MNALSKNRCLKKLIMNTCNVADFYLSRIEVGSYTNLTEILFDNNFVNDKGAKVFLGIIYKNPKILRLSLRKNCVSLKATKQLQQAIENNKIESEKKEPDLSYYQYIEEMQSSQKSALIAAIQKLQ